MAKKKMGRRPGKTGPNESTYDVIPRITELRGRGWSYEQIGRDIGKSREHVFQIWKAYCRPLLAGERIGKF